MLSLSLILSSSSSLRGTSRIFDIFFSTLELPLKTPSWYTSRLWLLRVGLYKLLREKEKADDWVWIIDHTVQIGSEKCLVILGFRLSSLPKNRAISHEDVEPLALIPVTKSNGKIVYQQLEETAELTGNPREILGDKGPDLNSGIEKFCLKHQETSSVYDIKHKGANVLKKKLQNNEAWQDFIKNASQTSKRLQQTALAAMSPPNQRSKSRYMNLNKLVNWGLNTYYLIDYCEKQNDEKIDSEQLIEKIDSEQLIEKIDSEQLIEKTGWIKKYKNNLEEWKEIIQVIETTEDFVRKEGLYKNCHIKLSKMETFKASSSLGKEVATDLLEFIELESSKAKEGETLAGSSEVIESVFGKLKYMEQDQANSGFTGLLLAIPAMVSETTKEVIEKAFHFTLSKTKEIAKWYEKNIGQSVQSLRKEISEFLKMEGIKTG